MWEYLDAAVTGDEQQYTTAAVDTQQPRDELRAAMRAQLGVVEEQATKVAPA